ncbi:unnamed protein product [Discosporangium mesarthrocarpum]
MASCSSLFGWLTINLHHEQPVLFRCSHLLRQPVFVLVRLALALNALWWLARSVFIFRNVHWLIYLTHWTYALETLYFCLALASAVALQMNISNDGNEKALVILGSRRTKGRNRLRWGGDYDLVKERSKGRPEMGALLQLQWALLYMVADTSLVVTVAHCFSLGDRWVDALDLQVHLFNSAFLILDVLLGAAPFLWGHILYAYAYAASYLLFDVAYFLIGGQKETHVAFSILDWHRAPWKGILAVLVVGFVLLPLAHSLHMMVARERLRLHRVHPDWGFQDLDELDKAMEMSGLRDTEVWAPLTGDQDMDLYSDEEEEEMGGAAAFQD